MSVSVLNPQLNVDMEIVIQPPHNITPVSADFGGGALDLRVRKTLENGFNLAVSDILPSCARSGDSHCADAGARPRLGTPVDQLLIGQNSPGTASPVRWGPVRELGVTPPAQSPIPAWPMDRAQDVCKCKTRSGSPLCITRNHEQTRALEETGNSKDLGRISALGLLGSDRTAAAHLPIPGTVASGSVHKPFKSMDIKKNNQAVMNPGMLHESCPSSLTPMVPSHVEIVPRTLADDPHSTHDPVAISPVRAGSQCHSTYLQPLEKARNDHAFLDLNSLPEPIQLQSGHQFQSRSMDSDVIRVMSESLSCVNRYHDQTNSGVSSVENLVQPRQDDMSVLGDKLNWSSSNYESVSQSFPHGDYSPSQPTTSTILTLSSCSCRNTNNFDNNTTRETTTLLDCNFKNWESHNIDSRGPDSRCCPNTLVPNGTARDASVSLAKLRSHSPQSAYRDDHPRNAPMTNYASDSGNGSSRPTSASDSESSNLAADDDDIREVTTAYAAQETAAFVAREAVSRTCKEQRKPPSLDAMDYEQTRADVSRRSHSDAEGPGRPIRPVDRRPMRQWLMEQLEKRDVPGLEWYDRKERMFKVPWMHGSRHGWSMEHDACLFVRWAKYTGRMSKYLQPDARRMKANFRSALNSLQDVEPVKCLSNIRGKDAFKVYRFTDSKTRIRR